MRNRGETLHSDLSHSPDHPGDGEGVRIDDQVAVGDVDREAGVVGQALANVGVEGQEAEPVDGTGADGQGMPVPVLARLGRAQRRDTGGMGGMPGHGGSMAGGVGGWGDGAPAAQHEAGEQECDQDVTHEEREDEGQTHAEG